MLYFIIITVKSPYMHIQLVNTCCVMKIIFSPLHRSQQLSKFNTPFENYVNANFLHCQNFKAAMR